MKKMEENKNNSLNWKKTLETIAVFLLSLGAILIGAHYFMNFLTQGANEFQSTAGIWEGAAFGPDFRGIMWLLVFFLVFVAYYYFRLEPPKPEGHDSVNLTKGLHCPKCGYPQFCGCDSCQSKLPLGYLPYKWSKDGNAITCGKCGFTASCDWWLTLEEDVFIINNNSDETTGGLD